MSANINANPRWAQASPDMRPLLADLFVVYMKTSNLCWHMSRRHFQDYRVLLDEYWSQIAAMTEAIAERARRSGESAIHPVAMTGVHQRRKEDSGGFVDLQEMLSELRYHNRQLARFLRAAHAICREENDSVTADVLKRWIDETEKTTWLVPETVLGPAEK